MSLPKILNNMKKINKRKNIRNVSHATIYTEDGGVFLNVNGKPFSIEIFYNVTIYLESNLGAYFRVIYKGSKFTIINSFNRTFPEKLFSYEGTFDIKSCQVMSYNGGLLKASIENNDNDLLIQNQKTNAEDDTLIIREEDKKTLSLPIKSGDGMKGRKITIRKPNTVERLDMNQVLTMIGKVGEVRKAKEKQVRAKAKTVTPIKKATVKKVPTKGGY